MSRMTHLDDKSYEKCNEHINNPAADVSVLISAIVFYTQAPLIDMSSGPPFTNMV